MWPRSRARRFLGTLLLTAAELSGAALEIMRREWDLALSQKLQRLVDRAYCYYNVALASWDDMHVISLRKAEKYEARYYFETTEESFE